MYSVKYTKKPKSLLPPIEFSEYGENVGRAARSAKLGWDVFEGLTLQRHPEHCRLR